MHLQAIVVMGNLVHIILTRGMLQSPLCMLWYLLNTSAETGKAWHMGAASLDDY